MTHLCQHRQSQLMVIGLPPSDLMMNVPPDEEYRAHPMKCSPLA
jgi:hypothetical protein